MNDLTFAVQTQQAADSKMVTVQEQPDIYLQLRITLCWSNNHTTAYHKSCCV